MCLLWLDLCSSWQGVLSWGGRLVVTGDVGGVGVGVCVCVCGGGGMFAMV
jgi:hypothetical protein